VHRILLRGGRVVLHTAVGGVLLVAGLVMLVTPGPGIVTVVLGLAVLAREYHWAHRLERHVLKRVRDASTAARARLAARRGARGHGDDVRDLRDRVAPAPDPDADEVRTAS
jgi:uncharacterized protein (TIGR02611 family)